MSRAHEWPEGCNCYARACSTSKQVCWSASQEMTGTEHRGQPEGQNMYSTHIYVRCMELACGTCGCFAGKGVCSWKCAELHHG